MNWWFVDFVLSVFVSAYLMLRCLPGCCIWIQWSTLRGGRHLILLVGVGGGGGCTRDGKWNRNSSWDKLFGSDTGSPLFGCLIQRCWRCWCCWWHWELAKIRDNEFLVGWYLLCLDRSVTVICFDIWLFEVDNGTHEIPSNLFYLISWVNDRVLSSHELLWLTLAWSCYDFITTSSSGLERSKSMRIWLSQSSLNKTLETIWLAHSEIEWLKILSTYFQASGGVHHHHQTAPEPSILFSFFEV